MMTFLFGTLVGAVVAALVAHFVIYRKITTRYVQSAAEVCKLRRKVRYLITQVFPIPWVSRSVAKVKCIPADRWN